MNLIAFIFLIINFFCKVIIYFELKQIELKWFFFYRTPVTEDFAEGYPSDEEWHGYINNKDRVLLKVISFLYIVYIFKFH